MILARLDKSITGTNLARISAEVLDVEDLKLLVKSGKVDWGAAAEGEDLAIIWALKNREEVVEISAEVNKTNLEGDPTADMEIICDESTLRVHKAFLRAKSTVFEASLSSGMKEEREGVIRIKEISHNTITAMMHFIYTGTLGDNDLNIFDVAYTAEKYNLPGWVDELCRKLRTQEEVAEEMVANMVIASSGYQGARRLLEVAVDKIKARKEMVMTKEFREKFRDHQDSLFDLIQEM